MFYIDNQLNSAIWTLDNFSVFKAKFTECMHKQISYKFLSNSFGIYNSNLIRYSTFIFKVIIITVLI